MQPRKVALHLAVLLALASVCAITDSALGMTVNRLNGGGNLIYIDFSIPGKVVPLELVRSYNSITAVNESSGWSGAFGWGWTSPFETTLTATPDHHVILRDGGTGNTVYFRPQKEDPKARIEFLEALKKVYFERKLGRKLSASQLQKRQFPQKIMTRLQSDSDFRLDMAEKYGMKGKVPNDELLISSEYGYQTVRSHSGQWIREKDGVVQYFDGQGRLVRQRDKNGFFFDFKYSTVQKLQLTEVTDEDHSMSLKFTWRQDRIVEVIDNSGHKAHYRYDGGGNLTGVTDSNNQSYAYQYGNRKFPHLLTRIDYLSESGKGKVYREIRYDDNGLVVFHREKDGTETSYVYGKGTGDPENNFWTKSIRKLGSVSEEQYDEYLIKTRSDGSKYLYKQENRKNGVTTVTVFTQCCGKPQQVLRNGVITNYKYYDNGLLQEKSSAKENIKLEYDPRWNKVTKVVQNGFASNYEYDDRGNLVRASNSKHLKVSLKYDTLGRILRMIEPNGKQISFKYNDGGKPVLITEKAVGTIRVDYNSDGKIVRTQTVVPTRGRAPSQAESQEVIRRVMTGFQALLDIIRPAGLSLQ